MNHKSDKSGTVKYQLIYLSASTREDTSSLLSFSSKLNSVKQIKWESDDWGEKFEMVGDLFMLLPDESCGGGVRLLESDFFFIRMELIQCRCPTPVWYCNLSLTWFLYSSSSPVSFLFAKLSLGVDNWSTDSLICWRCANSASCRNLQSRPDVRKLLSDLMSCFQSLQCSSVSMLVEETGVSEIFITDEQQLPQRKRCKSRSLLNLANATNVLTFRWRVRDRAQS